MTTERIPLTGTQKFVFSIATTVHIFGLNIRYYVALSILWTIWFRFYEKDKLSILEEHYQY